MRLFPVYLFSVVFRVCVCGPGNSMGHCRYPFESHLNPLSTIPASCFPYRWLFLKPVASRPCGFALEIRTREGFAPFLRRHGDRQFYLFWDECAFNPTRLRGTSSISLSCLLACLLARRLGGKARFPSPAQRATPRFGLSLGFICYGSASELARLGADFSSPLYRS